MANINRYMVPAEIPQPTFFQLPYDQMKEAILSAQQQQDTAKEGLSQIGDISFNYLTNSKVDPELAKNVYGELDSKVGNVLSQQGNGDLRGLRGEIYNLGKEVGRWYKPDGKIGRLQSNYLQYMDWYKRQTENKDLDPKYVQDAAKTFIENYDTKGGANAGVIYTEDLKKHFDYSKFVNDNKDMIKSTIIQRERDRLGNNGYKYTDEQLQKFITPEKIMYTLSDILQSNPDHLSSLQQRIRLGNLPKESEPILIQKAKDDKGNPIYGLNPYNPATNAINGAMIGLGGMEEDRRRFSIGSDEPWLAFWKRKNEEKDMKEAPGIPTGTEEVYKYDPELINDIRQKINDGDIKAIPSLYDKAQLQLQKAKDIFYDKNTGNIKSQYAKEFTKFTDLSSDKKPIEPADLIEAIALSTKENIAGNITVDEKTVRRILEYKGYKVDYNLTDGKGKAIKSALGLYSAGNTFDIPGLHTFVNGFNLDYKSKNSIGKEYFNAVSNLNTELKRKDIVIQAKPRITVDKNSKLFSNMQDIGALSDAAPQFEIYDPTSNSYLGTLDELMKPDDKNPLVSSSYSYSLDNVKTPNGTGDSYITLVRKDGTTNTVRIQPVESLPQTTEYLNQLINSHQLLRYNYNEDLPTIGVAGQKAKNSNLSEILRTLNTQDMNINEVSRNVAQDVFTKVVTLQPNDSRWLSTQYTDPKTGEIYKGSFKILEPRLNKNNVPISKYRIQIGNATYDFNNTTDLQTILTK